MIILADTKNTMPKSILTILFCALTITAFAQNEKTTCHDEDFIIKKTIKAINEHDYNAYVTLMDYDATLKALQEADKIDTSLVAVYKMMKSRKMLFVNVFVTSFSELLVNIEREVNGNQWSLTDNGFTIENKEDNLGMIHYTLRVKITVNEQKYHIRMYATKFHDCYYLFEPVEHTFSSGW